MKIAKIILTGVFATAMMSTSFAAVEIIQDTSKVEEVIVVEEVIIEEEVTVEEVEEDMILAEVIGNEADGRKEIKLTALPPAILTALKAEPFLDCKVEKAYLIKEDGNKTYEIEVKRGENQETLYFNEEGTQIER